jgi:hypothetical protein
VSELRELQRAFAAAVLDGHPGEIATRVRANGLDGAERVQIYCNNARVSLTQALADVFPVIERLVGDVFFAQLARAFLRAHPSRSGNLHGLGREMALFLCGLLEARALPYLADVAALEWAHHEVFHAADAVPLDVSHLARIPEAAQGQLRFRLHPATRFVASRYPIFAIWEANQDGSDAAGTIDLEAGADYLMVARRGLDSFVARLAPGEFALGAEISAGATLAQACEAALAADPAIDIGETFGRLVASGTIAGLYHF